MILQSALEISSIESPAKGRHKGVTVLQDLACVLLALVQVSWAGYQLGVGNQGIQIPFLEALHDHHLFTRDVMVTTTLKDYPSWFFALFAPLLNGDNLPALYLTLHLVATAGTLWAVAALARSLFRDSWAALVAVVILLAGHHQALAGESLYSTGLTHTWFVFPLTLLALTLFYRERYWAAFALMGAIFNLHALEAGQLAMLLGFVSLCEVRRIGWMKLYGLAAIFILMAAPTIVMMARQHQDFSSAEWLRLMHVRSMDHSFPSTWWQEGDPLIPRFLAIMGLAAVSISFGQPSTPRRKTLLLTLAVGITFIAGYVFTEFPGKIPPGLEAFVVRAQFFRSSRFLMVIALVVIAHGVVCGLRLPFQRRPGLEWRAWLEFVSAVLTIAAMAVPTMILLLPAALALATVVALINGRLAWYQALVAGVAMVVCLRAWQAMGFLIPGLSPGLAWSSLFDFHGPSMAGSALLAWGMIALAAGLWVVSQLGLAKWGRAAAALAGAGVAAYGVVAVAGVLLKQPAMDPNWQEAQEWARNTKNTKVDALFLVPPQQSWFRIGSQRAIVGDWRDGTQLYFSADFTPKWSERMAALEPGMTLSPDKLAVVSHGPGLERMDDDQLVELARKFGADYIVLPHSDDRTLDRVHDNPGWSIYRPKIGATVVISGDDPLAVQREYIQRVVQPAIDRNRKSDARFQVVDSKGTPLEGATYTLVQQSSPMGFGCSLPFFKTPDMDFHYDYKPPEVTPAELEQVAGVFNYSVTPFSGQWQYLQPVESRKPDYADLDAYVDWCTKHGVRVEFSFLSGYQPAWTRGNNDRAQGKAFLAHAQELVQRYGDKIDSWQVVGEKILLDQSPDVFAALRKIAPNARLGIADDARFWSPREAPAARQAEMLRGLDDLRALKKKGVKVDYFAIEADGPMGLWADARDVKETLDTFAKEGVKIHITQFGVPVGARIEGHVVQDHWTPALRAEYYEQFFSVCFANPNVDVINVFALGAHTWEDGEGLLDEKDQPTPAFLALKELITNKWRTRASGEFSLDGSASFRGFHGDYELAVTLPSGKTVKTTLSVLPGQTNTTRFVLDAAGEALTPAPEH